MTTLKAQEYLKQIEKLDVLIKNKLIEKQHWKEVALGVTPQMGGERVQSSGNQQKMASAVERMIDLERELDECVDRLINTRNDVIATIEQLSPEEYDFLHLVYVQHLTLKEVAEKKNYSYSWSTTFHGRALERVQRILDKRVL